MRGRASGHVLIVVLFVILVLMAAAALVANQLVYRFRLFQEESRDVRLTALTDAALAKALANLWRDPYYGGMDTTPFADGTIRIEVRPAETNTVEVVVWATCRGGRRAARAVVRVDKLFPPRFPPEVVRWRPLAFDEAGSGKPGASVGRSLR